MYTDFQDDNGHQELTRFGGTIYESDFDTENSEFHTLSYIASRIMSDKRFDKKCKENIKIYRDKNRG